MGGMEVFYNPLIRSQSFSGPVFMAVTFTSTSHLFFPHLDETGRLEGDGVGYFPSPVCSSGKTHVA